MMRSISGTLGAASRVEQLVAQLVGEQAALQLASQAV